MDEDDGDDIGATTVEPCPLDVIILFRFMFGIYIIVVELVT